MLEKRSCHSDGIDPGLPSRSSGEQRWQRVEQDLRCFHRQTMISQLRGGRDSVLDGSGPSLTTRPIDNGADLASAAMNSGDVERVSIQYHLRHRRSKYRCEFHQFHSFTGGIVARHLSELLERGRLSLCRQ